MTAGLFKMRSVVILGSDLLPSETTRNLTRSNTEMSTVQANRLLLTTPAYTYRISKLVDLERYRAVGRVENINGTVSELSQELPSNQVMTFQGSILRCFPLSDFCTVRGRVH